jgi:hypothetical protein
MKIRTLLLPLLPLLAGLACSSFSLLASPTPLPLPTELAATPLLPGAQPGALDAVFASVSSSAGAQDSRCYRLFRLYPDGTALLEEMVCLSQPPTAASWPEIERWFHRDNPGVPRGDYFTQDQRLWVRIVEYDAVHETTYLRSFQGETCGSELVLQEPAVTTYSGVPSALTQPVGEYRRIASAPGQEDQGGGDCHVAGFTLLRRPSIGLAGSRAEFEIQTDPGETCTLTYTAPDGARSEPPGTGPITAGSTGLCRWEWELGEVEGRATVTIQIDEITQDFALEVR